LQGILLSSSRFPAEASNSFHPFTSPHRLLRGPGCKD
jgi:hypothetical protein